jgi:hypothetical protein
MLNVTAEYLDNLPVNFILCTERTGSSLLSLMLNLHSEILSPSEEPFAIYFWKKYRKKKSWNEIDIIEYVDSFYLIADKNTDLYFSKRDVFLSNLLIKKEILNFERIIKLTYLHFLDTKDKDQIAIIIDKQIKYFFHLDLLYHIFPNAKCVVLTRDVRDNIVSKKNRKLNWNQNPFFLAALWNDTYSNCSKLNGHSFLVIKYELFMANPENTLKEICRFFGLNFDPRMLQTDGVYESFLEKKKNDVDPDFLLRLKNFHSGLSQKPNSDKIGQYINSINPIVLEQIEHICGDNLDRFSYQYNKKYFNHFSIKVIYFRFLAKCYRRYLLLGYLHIPLSLKLLIKKWRRKKKVV